MQLFKNVSAWEHELADAVEKDIAKVETEAKKVSNLIVTDIKTEIASVDDWLKSHLAKLKAISIDLEQKIAGHTADKASVDEAIARLEKAAPPSPTQGIQSVSNALPIQQQPLFVPQTQVPIDQSVYAGLSQAQTFASQSQAPAGDPASPAA